MSAVLSVTVGAKCTSLDDQKALERDLERLVDSIEDATEAHQFEIVEPV